MFSGFLVIIVLKKNTVSLGKSDAKNDIAKYFLREYSIVHFPSALEGSANFNAGNPILYHITFFNGKIMGTKLAMHLIKITARSSFTQ